MKKRFQLFIAALGFALSTVLAGAGLGNTASAVVDRSPDCDSVAVIRCGVFSASEMRQKAAQDDVPRIYNAMGISQNDLKGDFVNGIVWRDGRVTVAGKVVATEAMTAGRNYGGTPISGTNAGIYSTSKFVDEGQTAFVRMVDGQFKFAVIKACGNPVTATPKKPKEKPKFECVALKVEEISRTQRRFTAEATASGGATIEKYEFGFGDGFGVTAQEKTYIYDYKKIGDFRANVVVHVNVDGEVKKVTAPACRQTVTVIDEKIQVCVLATKTVATIDKSEFDASKHSTNLEDCKVVPVPPTPAPIKVCELSTKATVTIQESAFDSTKFSKNPDDCITTPAVLPATGGPAVIASGLMGSGALSYGAYSYLSSRRSLINKFLKR